MKAFFSLLAAGSLIVSAGCADKGSPGGPGVTKDKTTQKTVGQAEETFSLKPPATSTTIKQGESKEITIGMKRGKNFSENVALSFNDLPKGVTIEPSKPTIDGGKDEVKVTVKADDNADIGDHVVKVSGHPSSGPDATNELKLKVEKK
jgi:uncharacterized membrane protein